MKVLFILQSIGYGGSMTSLINLMKLLRNDRSFFIDVLFMDPYGELFSEAKETANICKKNIWLEASTMSRKNMHDRKLYVHLFLRYILALFGRIRKQTSMELGFDIAAKRYDNKYDCVVAYQESVATNFAIRIKSNRHIAWVHNDFYNVEKIYGNRSLLEKVYYKYDKIVCVSKAGSESFTQNTDIDSSKITYIYNSLPVEVLLRKASLPINDVVDKEVFEAVDCAINSSCIKIVSSGRFANQKRFDRAIEAAKLLKDKGYIFKWFILGNGELYDKIRASILSYGLEDYVFLTGGLNNPFPIVKKCDVFVLCSDFEAHPMVANEALILGVPVITTNYASASEVVKNEVTGLICDKTSVSLADALISFIDSPDLRYRIQNNVCNFVYSNNEIVRQVKSVLLNCDGIN